ncbi:MAG: hypothetical protein V2A79_01745 [Planctomycetota bacterium]
MSPHAPPHRWVRTLLLIVSTLAVVGVLFAIYVQYARPPAERQSAIPPGIVPPAAPGPGATTQPSGSEAMQIGGVPLPKGERTRINLYGAEGAQARLELEVESWEPVSGSEREFYLEKPTIRFRTPAGQLVNVTADRGRVEMTKQRAENYDMARGRLEGHVGILVDRLDEAQRAQLPPEQRDVLTDERKLAVELEDLSFDLEYARVESTGPIHVSLAEGEFEGLRLLLRYDEAASRIEYLKVAEGRQIVLRGFGGALAVTLPGATEPSPKEVMKEVRAPTPLEAPAAKPAAEAVEDDGVPLFVPEAPEKPRARETIAYTAVFDGDVVVDQFQGPTQTGLLSADRLAFLFDFGQEQRDWARQTPSSQSAVEPPVETVPRSGEGGESLVVLNWKGPLVVDLVREPGVVAQDLFGKRLQITATGREVHVADRQGSALCRKLVYHYETEQVWLYGDAESAFTLDLETGGRLSGSELSFDPHGRTARVVGPGLLSDPRGAGVVRGPAWRAEEQDGEVSVRFAKEMNLCLGTQTRESSDPITGEPEVRQQGYLQSAELVGDVVMAQSGGSLAADRVEIGFRPPAAEQGSLADTLENLHAEGRVRMVQGDEQITCHSIDVVIEPDATGRRVPVRAEAVGEVVAAQGPRAISATERMLVDLQSVALERPPFDPLQAKVAAVRRGLNPDEIDWDAQREKYERRANFGLGLRRIQAFGAVHVEDPEQHLRIEAGRLDCTFRDGRRLDKGFVLGRGPLPASVEFADFGIMGREIEFDAGIQWAEVPGPGRMTFASRKDLDGRALREPIPISVTWTDFMTFRGRENVGVFTGAVHTVSKDNAFDCRELVLDFEDETPAAARPATADSWDWWVLRPFRGRSGSEGRLRLEGPSIRKQLAYLSANGDVTGLTAAYDDQTGALNTRARIAGAHLAVDLRSQTQALTIDDAGTLLIEDYRTPAPDGSGQATKMSPFGAEVGNLPSQTFISWQGAMSYYGGNRVAVFEHDVELVYRSGSKLLLAEGVLSEAALAHMRESAEGRDARLLCQQLNVQFLREKDRGESAPAGGIGGLSGNQVGGFTASGGVYFEDAGVSVASRTITFDRERNLLQILGTRQQPAELIDQRHGRYRSIRGPTIYWERDTDRIEAPRSTIHVR